MVLGYKRTNKCGCMVFYSFILFQRSIQEYQYKIVIGQQISFYQIILVNLFQHLYKKEYQQKMLNWLWKIPVLIYDVFLSTLLTIPAHIIMMTHMTLLQGQFLDVGCGTGAPLKSILKKLRQNYSFITGVDLHPGYSKQAMELFKSQKDIQIENMNFYQLDKLNKIYDFIFFSFSFMLMPDPLEALKVAKNNLNTRGRIGFLMTLNKNVNPILRRIKPLIKLLTTVDFGNVVLESEFEEILQKGNLRIIKKERIKNACNPVLLIAPIYYVEAQVVQNY